MTIKTVTVNGKELLGFDQFDGTHRRATARRLLAHDHVQTVEEGGGADLTVWLRETELHWDTPDGWTITEVSFFGTDDHQNAAVAVELEEVDD